MVIQFLLQREGIAQVEFISRGSYELLGLASQQIRRNPGQALGRLDQHDRRKMQIPMLEMLQAGQPFPTRCAMSTPGYPLAAVLRPGRSQSEQGWRVYGVVQDVTTRVEQEQALQASTSGPSRRCWPRGVSSRR